MIYEAEPRPRNRTLTDDQLWGDEVRKVPYQGKEYDGEIVEFDVVVPEQWAVYKTKDGTVMRTKMIVSEIIKVVGEFQENGEPLYLYTHSVTTSISAKAEMQRDAQKKG